MKRLLLTTLILLLSISNVSAWTGGWSGGSGSVSDTAYDEGTWNGVTTIAPSKNAVRDKIETITGDVISVGDCASGACGDGSDDGGTYYRFYDGTSAYVSITAGVRTLTIVPSNANAESLVLTFGDNNNVVALSSGTGGVVNISGSAATATGNAATATALAADPANCAAGQIALGVTAAGVAECTATPSGLTSVGATTFTGALTGNASTATLASTVTVADEVTDADSYLLFVTAATGSLAPKTNAALAFNSSTGVTSFGGTVTLGANNLTLTGSIASTGSRVTKLWATDVEFTHMPTIGGATLLSALDTELASLAGLTFADVSVIQLTGAGTSAVLTASAANQLLGVNATNDALEFKSSINVSEINLPSSNADPGTTPGQIRHDSTDTGSNSGGTAKWYDGAQVRSFVDTGTNYTIITKTEYLPIRYAEDGTTGPAAIAEVSTTTAVARGFDKDADEDVVFWWIAPNDYVGGIKYRVIYALAADATADDTAVFSLAGCAAANSAALGCTPGTAVTLSDELTTDDDQFQVMISDYSSEVTVTNIAAGSLNRLVFLRDVSEDDYTEGDTLVIGIEIKYKAKIQGFGDY